jgi:hypothetical protein
MWHWLSRPEIIDHTDDVLEQVPRKRHLGHLEDGVTGVRDDLGADLHQFFPDGGQRPVSTCSGRANVRMKLATLVGMSAYREARPVTAPAGSHPQRSVSWRSGERVESTHAGHSFPR